MKPLKKKKSLGTDNTNHTLSSLCVLLCQYILCMCVSKHLPVCGLCVVKIQAKKKRLSYTRHRCGLSWFNESERFGLRHLGEAGVCLCRPDVLNVNRR